MLPEWTFLIVLSLAMSGKIISGHEVTPAGTLPEAVEFGTAVYDGHDSILYLGGRVNRLDSEVLRYNLTSQEVTSEVIAPFFLYGDPGSDGNGTFFHFGEQDTVQAEIYRFTSQDPLPVVIGRFERPRLFISTTSDGRGGVYVFSYSGPTQPEEIWRFDSGSGSLIKIGETALYQSTVAAHGDSIYGFGGTRPESGFRADIFRFSVRTGEVEVLDAVLAEPYGHAGAVTVGNVIYVIGGFNLENKFLLARFDTLTQTVEDLEVTNLDLALAGPNPVYVPKLNRIYVVGAYAVPNFYNTIFYIQL